MLSVLIFFFLGFLLCVFLANVFPEETSEIKSHNAKVIKSFLEKHKGQKLMAEIISASTGIEYSDVIEILTDLDIKKEKRFCEDGVKRYII